MKKIAFKAGDTIIREGDEGDTAFFIVSGAVDVPSAAETKPVSSAGLRPAKSSAKCR